VEAQYNLGIIFQHGTNSVKTLDWTQGMLSRIPQNIDVVGMLLLVAAEAGLPIAQHGPRVAFKHGDGIEENLKKVPEQYRKGMLSRILQNINTLSTFLSAAANAELPETQNKLGYMLEHVRGANENPLKTFKPYLKGILPRVFH
jgi:TPR repeat protein